MHERVIDDLRPPLRPLDPDYSRQTLNEILQAPRGPFEHRARSRAPLAAAAAVVGVIAAAGGAALVVADGGQGGPPGTADCTRILRYNGVEYRQVGFLDPKEVRELGRADVSECVDNGTASPGPRFPDSPDQEQVFTVPGAQPEEAISVRTEDGALSVYVIPAMTERRIEALLSQ